MAATTAAEATWRPGYTIDFTDKGDKTQIALLKGASQELAKIYKHLNTLQETVGATATIDIKGVVNTIADLPTTTTVGLLYLVGNELYMWTGEAWKRLYLTTAQEATENVSGVVRLGLVKIGGIDGVFSLTPSHYNAITEHILSVYNSSSLRGLPSGSIIMWSGTAGALPAGYAVCNGTNGTPDLKNKFVYSANTLSDIGVDGGVDTLSVSATSIKPHTHTFSGSTSVAGHSHAISITSGSTSTTHGHGSSGTTTLASAGSHTHVATTSTDDRTVDAVTNNLPLTETTPAGTFYRRIHMGAGYMGPGTESTHTHSFTLSGSLANTATTHAHSISTASVTSSASSASVAVTGNTDAPDTLGSAVSLNNIPRSISLYYVMKL